MMLGGTSLIPSVQATVRRIFGRDRVRLERPLDAVARGAAVFAAGMDFYDHIQHDYAIRSTNMTSGIEDYRVIVKRGTPYPTPAEALPSMRMRVRATHDGQARLGIDIFELGDRRARPASAPVELTFDPSGAARVRNVTPDDEDRRSRHWMNESARTFLDAESPVRQGEDRYEVEFSVDGNKRLLLTAKDLRFGRVVMRNQVVIRLT
jgi:molecular chaperone DnaK